MLGVPEEEQGGQPQDPGEGGASEGGESEQPGTGENPNAGEEGAEGEEGTEGEEDSEGEEGAEGEEGEEPAEPVDVTALFGEALARYIEKLEAEEDYEALESLEELLTDEQIESLYDVETTSIHIQALLTSLMPTPAEGIIEYEPAWIGPVGPVIRGSTNSFNPAGRMRMAELAPYGTGTVAQSTFKNPPTGMTVNKQVTDVQKLNDGSGREYFQLDLSVEVNSVIVDQPLDIFLVGA